MGEEQEYGDPTPVYQYLTPESSDGTEGWVIFADPEADSRPITDYRLCLTPSKHGDKFTIFQCAEELYIPDGTALMMAEEVSVVSFGDYQYNVMQCLMITPDSVDRCPSSHLITLPEEMQGKRIPVTECPDGELRDLLISSVVA